MNVLILVVDDEADMESLFRQQFRRDLREGRFVLGFAGSGEAALDAIRAAEGGNIILLLSDINMPGMTGLDLLEKARAIRPALPVIMITAYGDAQTRDRALTKGADNVLAKPIDFAALRAEVDRRLMEREGGR
jgi:CheY-like chemotaxis protein